MPESKYSVLFWTMPEKPCDCLGNIQDFLLKIVFVIGEYLLPKTSILLSKREQQQFPIPNKIPTTIKMNNTRHTSYKMKSLINKETKEK